MNLVELYDKTPVERHQDIVISGDRLFFDGELRLARSQKGLEQKLAQIETRLGIK